MVLEGANMVHNDKIRSNGPERSQLGTQCKNQVNMVLKGVNRVDNDKIGANGLERSQLGTQCKNQVKWSWKELIGYTMIKLGQMVLKGVNYAHNDKIISVLYERPNQNERFLLNNMFFSAFHCAFHWNALSISLRISVKCAAHFTEMRCAFHCAFHWNALCISLRISVKCAGHFSEMHSEMHKYMKCTVHFSEMRSAFQQYLMSFWVPTKYRSFLRKTKYDIHIETLCL